MKKKLSLFLVVALVLSLILGNTATVATASSKSLSKREKAIVKSYIKVLETGNLKYLNRYRYPGLKYAEPSYSGSSTNIKLLKPKFSKKYIKSKKLYCLYATGTLVLSTKDNLALAKVRLGIYVKKKGKKTYSYTEKKVNNKDVYVKEITNLDDLSQSDLVALENYLTEKYDEDTAYELMYPDDDITYSEEDEDVEDIEYSEDEENDSSSLPSTSSATFDSPVKVGESFSWSGSMNYLDDKLSASYSLAVKDSKDLSYDDLEEMGFARPTDNNMAYKLVTVKFTVSNAKLTKVSGSGSMYKSSLEPYVWGTKTTDGQSIIGGTDYGFDKSIRTAIQNKVGYVKLTPGDKVSFTVEGQIILPVVEGKTNYMVIENEFESNYDASMLYFKIE